MTREDLLRWLLIVLVCGILGAIAAYRRRQPYGGHDVLIGGKRYRVRRWGRRRRRKKRDPGTLELEMHFDPEQTPPLRAGAMVPKGLNAGSTCRGCGGPINVAHLCSEGYRGIRNVRGCEQAGHVLELACGHVFGPIDARILGHPPATVAAYVKCEICLEAWRQAARPGQPIVAGMDLASGPDETVVQGRDGHSYRWRQVTRVVRRNAERQILELNCGHTIAVPCTGAPPVSAGCDKCKGPVA